MASRRAWLASEADLRSVASMRVLVSVSADSGALQSGQRLLKPGLSGLSSNSSEQMAQVLMGNGIALPMIREGAPLDVEPRRIGPVSIRVREFGIRLPLLCRFEVRGLEVARRDAGLRQVLKESDVVKTTLTTTNMGSVLRSQQDTCLTGWGWREVLVSGGWVVQIRIGPCR